MISIDTNILLYAIKSDAAEHTSAASFLREHSRSSEMVIAELCLVELYLLLRRPAVMGRKLSAADATDVIQQFRSNPSWHIVDSAPVMNEVWQHAAKAHFANRRIFDVRLALTLRHVGVTDFATANLKDFQNLGFTKLWNPIES